MSDEILHDPLKPLAEINQPDSRSANFGESLDAAHADLSSMGLHVGVPVDVRQLFETAKNASLYSWHVYRFHQVSEMVGFQSLEFALRLKAEGLGMKRAKDGKRWTLGSLLKFAKENRWLSNDAYPSRRRMAYNRVDSMLSMEHVRLLQAGCDEPFIPYPTEEQIDAAIAYIDVPDILQKTVPQLRNNLAHGANTLMPNSRWTLRLIFESISQLYPRPKEC